MQRTFDHLHQSIIIAVMLNNNVILITFWDDDKVSCSVEHYFVRRGTLDFYHIRNGNTFLEAISNKRAPLAVRK